MLTSKEKEEKAIETKQPLVDLAIAFVLPRQRSDLEFQFCINTI